jgi:hypothetical protein
MAVKKNHTYVCNVCKKEFKVSESDHVSCKSESILQNAGWTSAKSGPYIIRKCKECTDKYLYNLKYKIKDKALNLITVSLKYPLPSMQQFMLSLDRDITSENKDIHRGNILRVSLNEEYLLVKDRTENVILVENCTDRLDQIVKDNIESVIKTRIPHSRNIEEYERIEVVFTKRKEE